MAGLLTVKNNEELNEEERKASESEQANTTLQTSHLVNWARIIWERNKRAKLEIEMQMLKDQRQVAGEYEPEKLAAIEQMGGSKVYVMMTAAKCRTAKAWVNDSYEASGNRPYTIKPTPLPELPDTVKQAVQNIASATIAQEAQAILASGGMLSPEVIQSAMQEAGEEAQKMIEELLQKRAKEICLNMEEKINDQLDEARFATILKQVISDVMEYPAGILKGPVLRRRKVMTWNGSDLVVESKIRPEPDRVSPFDAYPAPLAKDANDGEFCERTRLTITDLQDMLGVPGYDDTAILEVMKAFEGGNLRDWLWTDQQRAEILKQGHTLSDINDIDCIVVWGAVKGQILLDWGIDSKRIPDPKLYYECSVWLIQNWVIKATLNKHPLGHRPYFNASYENTDRFWGKGIPSLIADLQEMINASARAMANNMSIASGPQVDVNADRMKPGANSEDIWPWKIWKTTNKGMLESKAINFYQPNMVVEPLMAVYERFRKQADEDSGIPSYAHGDTKIGGAGNTSSGLSMLMSAASRGIKQVIGNIDTYIIAPFIERMYWFNMLYTDDPSIKGDAMVVARGINSVIAKEQLAIRRREALAELNNPVDLQLTGLEGRRVLLRETVKSLEVPVEEVVPDRPEPIMPEQPQGEPKQGKNPQALDVSGNPQGGKDFNLNRKRL